MSYYVPTEKEVMDLLSKPDLDTVKGRRDKAILELLYSSGLRREEMHNLNIDDIDFTENTVRVNQGKFKKDRVVPLGKIAKERSACIPQKIALQMAERRPGKGLIPIRKGR